MTPDGKFLYALGGVFNCISPSPISLTAYAVDPASGKLTAGPVLTWINYDTVAGGATMTIDPLGRFLYLATGQADINYAAATVVPYAINADSGALTPIGSGTAVASNAGAMTVDPTGRYLYVVNDLNSNAANDTVLAMAIDQSSGEVSPLGLPLETAGPGQTIVCEPLGRFVFLGADSGSSLTSFAISTAASNAGQLLPSGQGGPSGETMALAIVE